MSDFAIGDTGHDSGLGHSGWFVFVHVSVYEIRVSLLTGRNETRQYAGVH